MPNQAQVEEHLQRAVQSLGAVETLGRITEDNIVDMVADESLEAMGLEVEAVVRNAQQLRRTYAAMLDDPRWAAKLTPIWQLELNRTDSPQRVAEALAVRGAIFRDFISNARTVESRDITRDVDGDYSGDAALDAPYGDGFALRLVVDEHDIGMQHDPDVCGFTARCMGGAGLSGAATMGSESFRVEPNVAIGADALSGSQRVTPPFTMQSRTTFQSPGLQNPSFDSGAADGDDLVERMPSWTLQGGLPITTANAIVWEEGYATRVDRANRRYLRFTQSTHIVQELRSVPPGPVGILLWVRRQGASAEGTITLHIGSRTQEFTHAELGAGWAPLILDPQDWWPNRWWTDAGDPIQVGVNVAYTALPDAGDGFCCDDMTFLPFAYPNGLGLAITAGHVPWQYGDTFGYADTENVSPLSIQRALAIAYRLYLPHDPAPSILDPTLDLTIP